MSIKIKKWNLRIKGKELAGENNKTLEVINPYSKKIIALVSLAGEKEYEEALKSATQAFQITKKLPAYKRSEQLAKIASLLKNSYFEEMAQLISEETGKPIALARVEVERGINTFELAAAYALTLEGSILNSDVIKYGENRKTFVERFPLGVIAAITPYNWPLNLVAHKLAPAILAGNTVVLKPASSTPLSSLLLADICQEAGIPAGQINVIPCPVSIAEKLVTDERIKLITFTGSPAVGFAMKQKCGKKKISLELGGNAAAIVEADAHLEKIIPRLVAGSFNYAGQVCISLQRLFIQEKIFEDFLKLFVEETKKLKLFNIEDDKVICGPLINEKEALRVESWVQEALNSGAKLLWGGERQGNCYSPTVLTQTKASMKVNAEEIFGPVVTLEKYSSFEEALEKVNRSQYGLQAAVYTQDINKAFSAYQELEVGGVMINDFPSFRVDNIPYGGVKNSGFGGREGIKYAYEEMTELKHLTFYFS